MRRGELIFNYLVLLGPIVLCVGMFLGLGLAIEIPHVLFWLIIALFLSGFASFAKAKLSMITQGRFFSLGTRNMSRWNKVAYYCGYCAMVLGLILSLGFFMWSYFKFGNIDR
jgi:hypothetical protein